MFARPDYLGPLLKTPTAKSLVHHSAGVADVRDESDREGMRVVVEPKRGVDPAVILNSLYQTTTLQSRFPVNMVAIVNRQPETLSLKDCLRHFLDFRIEVVEKRARWVRSGLNGASDVSGVFSSGCD